MVVCWSQNLKCARATYSHLTRDSINKQCTKMKQIKEQCTKMKQIKEQCTMAMQIYLTDNDLDLLIAELRSANDHLSKGKVNDKSLWFRFFPGDTAVTTVEDIKRDLSLPVNHGNHKYMVDNFMIAI